jgi:hypothetical protein
VSGNATGTLAVSGCNSGLGKGTVPGSALATGSGVITWKGHGKGTTTISVTATSPGQGACASGSVEEDATGTVTADTSGKVTVGSAVSARACVNSSTGAVSLVKHTDLAL